MARTDNAKSDTAVISSTPGTPATTVDAFLDTKLHLPVNRSDWVLRTRLLNRVNAALTVPVTLVAAPAGYGKTILLTQFVEQANPRTAWVSLDAGDNDPHRLCTHITAALERAGCAVSTFPPPDDTQALPPHSTLHAILAALRAHTDDILLVLDDFNFIRSAHCHRQMEFLIEHLPAHVHLVIVTRSDPGLRLGRLRASGGLLEIRADELGFTLAEAEALFKHEQVALTDASVSTLVERTEGWPAGLYLASLSLAGRSDPDAFVRDFSGDNRFVGDYLTEEVLSSHTDEVREFILRVSILDRFSASLCDHLLANNRSASILRDLERTNLFVVPLDDEGRWYRFHHLFAAVARSELELTHPHDVEYLQSRAAQWFSVNGNVDEAVKHSIDGADFTTAARLVQENWLEYVDAGRVATVLRWIERIDSRHMSSDPAATATAAWMAAITGDEAALTEQLAVMRQFADYGPLPDGSRSIESAAAMIQALFGYCGPTQMLRSAETAVALETDQHSPFYSVAQVTLGHAAYVMGDLDRAAISLALARQSRRGPVTVQAFGLATESLVEDERRNFGRSRELAEQSLRLLAAHELRATAQASLAYSALGQAHSVAGQHGEAMENLEHAHQLHRMTVTHSPWATVHHLLVHARVAVQAGRPDLARPIVSELDSRVSRFTEGMSAMQTRLSFVRQLASADTVDGLAGEPLTGREIDILRLLRGTMSLHEIADELFVSFNTVKTHSRAVYRKLGVHSRAEAVQMGRRQGIV